jgi:hypothetical protein
LSIKREVVLSWLPRDALVPAADPVDDAAAVPFRFLLPALVAGVEVVDLAVREKSWRYSAFDNGTKTSWSLIWVGVWIVGRRSLPVVGPLDVSGNCGAVTVCPRA